MPATVRINNKRNPTADLLKGIAVIFMIQVHIMELFAKQEIYDSIIGKVSLFLGGPPCAPVFMAVMGYFIASSEKPFIYFFKRGIILFTGGIILNIARSANLLHYIYIGQSPADPFFYIFGVDILSLAGLSIFIIGLLQLIFKRNYIFYFILAIFIVAITPFLPVFGNSERLFDFANAFLWGNFGWSYFPVFPWLAYVLIGFAFRFAAEQYKILEKFGTNNSLVFSIPLLIAAGITILYAAEIAHNLKGEGGYYHHGILYFGWVMLFMAGYIMFANLIEEYSGKSPLVRFVKWVGKNVTIFYIFQWLIIGNIATEIFKTQKKYNLIFWFLGITAVVSILTYIWGKIKIYLSK
ncbi:MAG: acyltransferase family protein [Bacteroidales bacterium]